MGFPALVEADGRRVRLDTGNRPATVLQNAKELGLNLSTVSEVVLTHNHDEHVGGLLTLCRELMKKNRSALSRVHVAKGIFYSRHSGKGKDNAMIDQAEVRSNRRPVYRTRSGGGDFSRRLAHRAGLVEGIFRKTSRYAA